ncbi:MAG: alpha/beta hydrolase [Micromonospora sp.]
MAERRAVLIPGVGYDTRAPLFAYVGEALRRLGFETHEITWQVPRDLPADRTADWVREQVTPALENGADLLVGKSLGTFATGLAADHGLAAVWLTPLLNHPDIVDALGRATAPFLLVGGTADKLWNGEVARRLSPHVVEIPDADHSMLVPGPLARSAEVLGQVCTAVEDFVR